MKIDIKQLFREPDNYIDKDIRVAGWVRTVRDSKTFGFIEINDGSFFKNLQVVFDENGMDNFKEVAKLAVGTSIWAEGKLVATPQAKQPFELKASRIDIEGACTPEYPLQKKRHSFEFLRTIAHLRPRTNTYSAVFRLRSAAAFAIHRFFQEKGFVYVHTPIITSSDCEGAGEMFRVTTFDISGLAAGEKKPVDFKDDFFGKQTSLTVSGQLAAEAYSMAFGNVYTFGPTFRAENSNTARHAAEFWMIEPEIAFADINDDMAMAEEMIKYLINYCLENLPEEMEFFNSFVDNSLL
ncbi:MAG: asparagine--tRNA ligase, partial [Clostridiales bacterium]|nr:asparagine--tRNA ligase [Clostridiales bacterium]